MVVSFTVFSFNCTQKPIYVHL